MTENRIPDNVLREGLKNYGIIIGPITDSTRKVYERKLNSLLNSTSTGMQTDFRSVLKTRSGSEREHLARSSQSFKFSPPSTQQFPTLHQSSTANGSPSRVTETPNKNLAYVFHNISVAPPKNQQTGKSREPVKKSKVSGGMKRSIETGPQPTKNRQTTTGNIQSASAATSDPMAPVDQGYIGLKDFGLLKPKSTDEVFLTFFAPNANDALDLFNNLKQIAEAFIITPNTVSPHLHVYLVAKGKMSPKTIKEFFTEKTGLNCVEMKKVGNVQALLFSMSTPGSLKFNMQDKGECSPAKLRKVNRKPTPREPSNPVPTMVAVPPANNNVKQACNGTSEGDNGLHLDPEVKKKISQKTEERRMARKAVSELKRQVESIQKQKAELEKNLSEKQKLLEKATIKYDKLSEECFSSVDMQIKWLQNLRSVLTNDETTQL